MIGFPDECVRAPWNIESKPPPPASKSGVEVSLCMLYWEQAETPDM